ncbi:hypothetical protein COV53_00390 [Candidatus Gottesmanbacteria bacterium CG11_big_fil_rev_8_21_14_0_20_37_11]|uniref:Glycosyltransferase subfamily 4-like N-terminal domain-containing protein n=3 Tax=Candidatus Gottesmaniibacteriota TaxID=1752720 RepID=A0A2M7RSJ7_9BACT|nr:MAG: hypothetical protein AUJ73_01980 [Candidatus Gottesmanbacteria bacterium CG1_02_37_22]PIP32789.1 MAG: hypothetical protein COX23_02850 [Candidatus Gottesmanbacteria bacterium CG23_combo_of_CG06-09_8_20_14_all_37_19]PIR08933.1 MAG: hypothetical protein COV53_00390 [Candidatus Gottesmanbacteria bacterium CG11_big_fil_rev_8_21_14_0_20_37_11]PIZ03273.1 MAG: hypothetical protein COY59_00400 [Candidatus Gottesmanbacteria bacterium CG_4_10_14_0_8_um_filter_37_24]
MNILFSLTYYTPYISGLTLHVQMIAEALADRGYNVSVLSMRYKDDLSVSEIVNKIRVVRANTLFKISKGFISFDWLVKSIKEVNQNQVVIINLPQFEGVITALCARLFRKRIVVFYHCDVILPSSFLNFFVQKVLYLSNYLTLFLADVILHSTKDFADHSVVLNRFQKKLKFIYPPIKGYILNKRAQKILKKRIGNIDKYKVGFVGRMAADKGLEYLLQAIPLIKIRLQNQSLIRDNHNLKSKFKVIIAGPTEPVGEESYKERINMLIEANKGDIILLGKLKDKEMAAFYSLMDVLVLPSINSTESFGTVQVEAMMMGVPIVASDLPGVRIPVQKTGMGKIVPIRSSQAIAEAVVELFDKKGNVNTKYNISITKKEFSISKTVDFYEKIIQANE